MLTSVLLTNLLTAMGIMVLAWCVSVRQQSVNIADVCWGLGFVFVAWVSAWTAGSQNFRSVLLVGMVTAWGLRLAGYLAWRCAGKPEDYRYADMRNRHGRKFVWISLVTVFGLQGLCVWAISLPLQVGISQGGGWVLPSAIGMAVWGLGLAFESVGDYQLARFKSDPENCNRVMNSGLWRYTRHPNYFGDFLVWWGLYFVAAERSSWWWTWVGPLLMSFLLTRVSGVPLLERSLQSRLEGYDEYTRTTNAFFPWPPRIANRNR